jgi:hypothetical protein
MEQQDLQLKLLQLECILEVKDREIAKLRESFGGQASTVAAFFLTENLRKRYFRVTLKSQTNTQFHPFLISRLLTAVKSYYAGC